MRNMKRWLAVALTIAMTFSDCGMMSVFATEDAAASEASVSENSGESPQAGEEDTAIPDEVSADREAASDNGAGQAEAAETGLPALHIGQIKKGEELPTSEDSEFAYDLPISFEMSDSLLLFVNYGIDAVSEEEGKGTLVWSILRGEEGLEAGSASLVDEEDDWIGLEAVADSPYFTMTETEEGGCYQMVELVSKAAADDPIMDDAGYNYYIRAAYYLGTGEDKDEAFYAAATVLFLPINDAADITQDDGADTEEADTDQAQDDMSDTEAALADEAQDADLEGNGALTEDESGAEEMQEDMDAGNLEADAAAEDISTVSENDMTEGDAAPSEGDTESGEQISELILDRESITMRSGETVQVTARTKPENIQAKILWESGNEAVATVNENGEIHAKAEGYARITAQCGDLTAVVRVEVAPTDGKDKVIDLSGDIWVAGFQRESEDFVYSGQKITQDIRVYHKETLLKEKTDYTLSYKNNVNAAAYNTAKAPGVTITLKGQYSGSVTLYYTIRPLDINAIDSYNTDKNGTEESRSPGYEQTVAYSANLKLPNPDLTFGKKKLAVNKDFVCDYTTLPTDYKKGDSYETGKVYNYTVNGIGNFTGSFQMQLVVLKDKALNFGSASVMLGQKQYEYRGTALSKSDVTIEQVKLNNQILDKNLYDYEVCAKGIEGAYVTVYPSDAGRNAGYRGCKKVALKLAGDRKISDADLGNNWKESIPFSQKTVNKNGGIYQDKEGLLTFGTQKEPLTEGEDYAIKYSNAQKAGQVTVTFTGKGRYKGSLKKKYAITPNSDQNNLTIVWGKNVTKQADGTLAVSYQKGGASPDFTIRDQDRNVLKIKTDYTVKLKDNKTLGTIMSCEITGKGNYKGYTETVQLKVTAGDISLASISIPDKPYSTKPNAWKSKVTIKDVNGKTLAAGTDYEKEPAYEYTNMADFPAAGSTVTVTVRGMGCYAGSVITGSYRIYKRNISQLKIVIDNQEYTGEEISLTPRVDIHAYATSKDAKNQQNEIWDSCYLIEGYTNNIKAGTAKVTLRGIGDYGGTKTYSFKIQKKAYGINRVKQITFDKTSLAYSLAEKDEAKRTLTATITAQTGERIANPTVIWSVSDSRIADIETRVIDERRIDAVITLKKEGSVTITATTQDGNKKAQCKVKIVDAPLLKQAGQKIEGEAGQTHRLELEKAEAQEVSEADIKWESNNTDVVAVSKDEKDGLFANLTMKKTGAAVIKVTYRGYVQECYAIVIGEETLPEGKVYTYEQKPGCMDDTPEINKFLREWEWGDRDKYDCLYIPAGVYHIDAVAGGYDKYGKYKFGGIVLTENQKLVMSPSALLVAIGNSSKNYQVIYAFGRDNVTISGGQIIGERKEHKGTGGEWGHGISIQGCTNVYISDIDISQCWGDGIYLGFYDGPNKSSSGVIIENCNLHHNRRNNLSITDASNVTVRNSQFNYAKGTDPQYGIDIEPNQGRTCSNVTISGCKFQGNGKGTIQILGQLNAHVKGVRIENCIGDKAPVEWSGFGGSVSGVTYKNNKWN